MHSWVVMVRMVADGVDPVIAAYADDDGAPPDEEQRARLQAHIAELFRERWGIEPQRMGVAVLPWIQADGELLSWKRVLTRARGR
jgi:hypothetical protein